MPNTDKRAQQPYSVSQIENSKPNVPRTASVLSGYLANSMNAGHDKVIAFKQVMAGEKHREYRLKACFQLLTPKTPAYQNLKITIRTYFVPNSRVWKNAEKFTAQKGGTAEVKIEEIPNLGGKQIPNAMQGSNYTVLTNTTAWRDSFISSYIPRIGTFVRGEEDEFFMAKVSALPLRGRIAIYNDMERNKEYDEEYQEYNDDIVSTAEWNSYLPFNAGNFIKNSMRAKKPNSYFSDYRTDVQGFEATYPPDDMSSDMALMNWASWESKIAEARSEAENAQLNDWQIIAKIRGSKVLTEGKVQKIGEKTIRLNYSAITQNTYNTNENVSEEFRALGMQGAYSYTEIDTPLYAGIEFIEEGYIHVIATITADTVYESAYDRLEMNVNALDMYRPDLEGDKLDYLYRGELGQSAPANELAPMEIIGFKRKYSEYFKLPNCIAGDMTSKNYVESVYDSMLTYEETVINTKKTYQFFMDNAFMLNNDDNYTYTLLKIWKDYSDLMLNKNQAAKNTIVQVIDTNNDTSDYTLKGNNQIFFVGTHTCIAELPINEEIKHNYTVWGEH